MFVIVFSKWACFYSPRPRLSVHNMTSFYVWTNIEFCMWAINKSWLSLTKYHPRKWWFLPQLVSHVIGSFLLASVPRLSNANWGGHVLGSRLLPRLSWQTLSKHFTWEKLKTWIRGCADSGKLKMKVQIQKLIPETMKYCVGVQRGQPYLMRRKCLFSLGWQPF